MSWGGELGEWGRWGASDWLAKTKKHTRWLSLGSYLVMEKQALTPKWLTPTL